MPPARRGVGPAAGTTALMLISSAQRPVLHETILKFVLLLAQSRAPVASTDFHGCDASRRLARARNGTAQSRNQEAPGRFV